PVERPRRRRPGPARRDAAPPRRARVGGAVVVAVLLPVRLGRAGRERHPGAALAHRAPAPRRRRRDPRRRRVRRAAPRVRAGLSGPPDRAGRRGGQATRVPGASVVYGTRSLRIASHSAPPPRARFAPSPHGHTGEVSLLSSSRWGVTPAG